MEDLLPYRWKCLLLLKEMETELQRLRVEEACGAGKVSVRTGPRPQACARLHREGEDPIPASSYFSTVMA